MEPTTDLFTDRYGIPKYAGQRMAKADFLHWESDDNYVYEYNNGTLEPTTSMRQDEDYLLTNLENHFFQTDAFKEGSRLRAEMDIWLTEKQMRRHDVSYFTADQLKGMAAGENEIAKFTIEFSSESDDMAKSIKNYTRILRQAFRWCGGFYPLFKEVYVYTSPKTVTICTDTDILNAAPALPELQLTVDELFRR
ncbi:hypothetical protein ACFSUS_24225 [Spirosoma soli]|uniref:Uncharacterized protein n=1 Tax=Spirosoma soli TaxID=1770529 RepID=A0ABW5MAZ1_9BACT